MYHSFRTSAVSVHLEKESLGNKGFFATKSHWPHFWLVQTHTHTSCHATHSLTRSLQYGICRRGLLDAWDKRYIDWALWSVSIWKDVLINITPAKIAPYTVATVYYTCQLSRIVRDSPAWEPKYRLSRMRDENLPHGEAFWIASIKQVTKVQDKSQVSVEVCTSCSSPKYEQSYLFLRQTLTTILSL